MSRNKKIDPQPPGDNADLPPRPQHDPIEPDPANPVSEQPPDAKPTPAERPDLDWAEHED